MHNMHEVAHRAGVSLGTVSNVLNHPELVSDETRARVERTIEELGFVRNGSARHLRVGATQSIGLMVLDVSNPFFTEVARGAEAAARERGYDSGKQVQGRKRHVQVDTEGLLLTVTVHPADSMDRDGVKQLLPETIRDQFPRLEHVWLDAGDNGRGTGKDWIEQTLHCSAQIVAHPRRPSKVWIVDDLPDDQIDWSTYLPPPGFRVLPRR